MRLYCFPEAPNPTKVPVYMREKGIGIEMALVNLRRGEHCSCPGHFSSAAAALRMPLGEPRLSSDASPRRAVS